MTTSSWHSYPKLYAMGHRAIADLLLDDVIVQEKVDGSQFSFGVFDVPVACDQGQHGYIERELEGSPRDIGALIKETQADIIAECREEITEALTKWALPQILRGSIGGLPEWYKEVLLKQQFETPAS